MGRRALSKDCVVILLGLLESRLPANLPAYVKELATNPGSLAVATTTYLLVTGEDVVSA